MRHLKLFLEAASAKEDNPIHYSELQDLCDKYYALPYSDKKRKIDTLDEFVELFGTVFGDINHSIQKWLKDDDAKRLIRMFKQGGYAFHVASFPVDSWGSNTEAINDFLMDGWSTMCSNINDKDIQEVVFYKQTNLFKVHQNRKLRDFNKKTGIFEKLSKVSYEVRMPLSKISKKYSLLFWIDEEYDEKPWNLSFENLEDVMDGLTFACEDVDDNLNVVITDHGLVQDQYMNEEQLEILKLLKLKIGQRFRSMRELYNYIKLVLSKKVDGLLKTGVFENLKEKTDLYLKTGYGYDLKQWIIEFGDHFNGTGIHIHRLDKWLSEAECLEIFNMYLHKGYDFLVESGNINSNSVDMIAREKEGWKVLKLKEFSKYDCDVIFYKENKNFYLMDNVKDLKKTGVFENANSDEIIWKLETQSGNFQIYLNGYKTIHNTHNSFDKKVFQILFYGTGWKKADEQNEEWNYLVHDTIFDKQTYGEWTQYKTLEEVIFSFSKKGIVIPRKNIEEYKEKIMKAIFGNFIDSEKVMNMHHKTGLLEKVGIAADFSVFEELFSLWKKMYLECIKIANKHGYNVIQERLDSNYTYKIKLVLECDEDETFNVQRFQKLYQEIDNFRSYKMDILDKRIVCSCNTDQYHITNIQKSKKLKHLNDMTGLFENSEELLKKINQKFDSLKTYPYIDIYVD